MMATTRQYNGGTQPHLKATQQRLCLTPRTITRSAVVVVALLPFLLPCCSFWTLYPPRKGCDGMKRVVMGDLYSYHLVMQAGWNACFSQCSLSALFLRRRRPFFSPNTCAVGVTIQDRQSSSNSVVISATCATTPVLKYEKNTTSQH